MCHAKRISCPMRMLKMRPWMIYSRIFRIAHVGTASSLIQRVALFAILLDRQYGPINIVCSSRISVISFARCAQNTIYIPPLILLNIPNFIENAFVVYRSCSTMSECNIQFGMTMLYCQSKLDRLFYPPAEFVGIPLNMHIICNSSRCYFCTCRILICWPICELNWIFVTYAEIPSVSSHQLRLWRWLRKL